MTMQEENNIKPGVTEMVLTLFVILLTFEEINKVNIYDDCVVFHKYLSLFIFS